MSLTDDLKTIYNSDKTNNSKTVKNKTVNKPDKILNTDSLILQQKLNRLFCSMRTDDNVTEIRTGLHASSIIKGEDAFCFRAMLLSLFYKQSQGEELSVETLRIFAAGDSIHEKWQRMFVKSKIAILIEGRSFSKKYDLSFTPDALVRIDCIEYIAEIKSMNTFAFKKAKSHPSGEKQCMLYMHFTGVRNGFVLAEDKNNQEIKVFPVKYDYSKIQPYLERLEIIQEMKKAFIENNEVPARKCKTENCSQAKNCGMQAVCWGSKEYRKLMKF